MNNQEQLEQVELSIDQAKYSIEFMASLDRLTSNPDFVKIVLEGYFEAEAQRLVMLRVDPNFQEDVDQSELLRSIDSIGTLKMYFNMIMQFGVSAQRAMTADEATREEILAEDLANG